MKIENDDIIFESTGIKQYANCGIVGINPELEISGGYDDHGIASVWDEDHKDTRDLVPEERKELAQYMIELWTKYANQP